MDKPTKLAPNLVDEFMSAQQRKHGQGDRHGGDEKTPERRTVADDGREKTVRVRFTTHDAGGITSLDVEMPELCEHACRR